MSTRVGLGVPEGMLGTPFPSCPSRLAFYGSGVPRDSPLEGHSLWDFALITTGKARSSAFYFLARHVVHAVHVADETCKSK